MSANDDLSHTSQTLGIIDVSLFGLKVLLILGLIGYMFVKEVEPTYP